MGVPVSVLFFYGILLDHHLSRKLTVLESGILSVFFGVFFSSAGVQDEDFPEIKHLSGDERESTEFAHTGLGSSFGLLCTLGFTPCFL